MLIVNVNGPINAGKSTVCRLLAKDSPDCLFIEVDDLLSDAEQKAAGLDFTDGIEERLRRLDQRISAEKSLKRHAVVLFAYPMEKENYRRWKKYEDAQTVFVNITLSPSLSVCLTDRGKRALDAWEIKRIKQMYDENYHCPEQSDLIIDNTEQTPERTVNQIKDFLKKYDPA